MGARLAEAEAQLAEADKAKPAYIKALLEEVAKLDNLPRRAGGTLRTVG